MKMDAPGGRILLRPGALGRGGRLRRGVPGHGRLPVPARSMIRGWCPSLAGIQIEDTGGIRIVLAGFPSLALCVVTCDQFRRRDDGPRAACTWDRGASAMAIRKTLSAAEEYAPSAAIGKPSIRREIGIEPAERIYHLGDSAAAIRAALRSARDPR
jgi:hypothetical protein